MLVLVTGGTGYLGSHSVAALARAGHQLWLHPAVLGGGKRLFGDSWDRVDLRLVESTTTGTGLVILTYQRA